ncbi:MAG TPA: MFS transporter [Ramlibacter sp.]|nr:MFS transporter [Ramlibacter sp.]
MAGLRMSAPLLALQAGYSQAAVGGLLALFSLMPVFIALPAGRFADRHGLKKPVGWAVIAAALGAALAAAFPVLPMLCLAALLSGGATVATLIALQRHVGRAAAGPSELRKVFSWLAIGPAISNFIGPFLSGLIIDHVGYRAAFTLLALLPLVCWLCVRTATELPPVEEPAHGRRTRAWDLFRSPVFTRLMLVNWFLSSAWELHSFVLPVLGHERGLSASVIGTILGAFALSAAAIRLLLPVVAARVREWALIATAMIVAAAVYGVYPLMDSALAMGACSMVLGLALGLVQPMVMSMLHQVTPEHRHGEAVGMRMMVINASSVLMPTIFGAASAAMGVAGLFWTIAALVGGGTRVAFRLRDDRKS